MSNEYTDKDILEMRIENADLWEDKSRLQQENDDLRAALLEAPNAQMVDFIAAVELHLQSVTDGLVATKGQYRSAPVHVLRGFLSSLTSEWNNLKAKHLKTEVAE